MVIMKSKLERGAVVSFFSILLFISCVMPIVNSDDETTSVSIEPASSVVGLYESFTIGVYCNPCIPMKSFECSIIFDPSLLSVTDVREGTIFNGYETFFNDGSIDNTNGEINLIYGLIMGEGNVTNPGYLIWIDFQAEQNTGQSTITLSNVGVTNETMYIPITISHGLVEVQNVIPSIEDVTAQFSDPLDSDPLFGWYQISSRISDDNLNNAYLVMTHPDSSVSNNSMTKGSGDLFSLNASIDGYGTYSYYIYAIDDSGNSVSSNVFSFEIYPNWDVNMNGDVSVLDFILISNMFGETGSAGWVREDVDNNGHIQVLDIVIASNHYGDY